MAKPSMRLFAFSITDASIFGNDASISDEDVFGEYTICE